MQKVKDVMSSQVVTIEPGARIVGAARRMIVEDKGPLPVVEGGRVVGILTDRDIISRLVAEGQDPQSVNVEDIHTNDLVTIGPEQDVEEARQLMARHHLERILVVEDDRHLVGIVSMADLP
jgi:CBS domain-containing protein